MSNSLQPHGMQQASLSFTVSLSLLKLMFIESVMPSNHFILSCPLLLLPSIFPSIRVFSNESALRIRWLKYWSFSFSIISVQFNPSVMSDPLRPQGLQHSGFPIHPHLLELTQTHVHWIYDAIQPSHPLSFPSFLLPPSIFPSIRVFFSESVLCIRWPKYWSFSFSISPSNKYSELISFTVDWFDLFAIQGTFKSLL